MKATTAPHGVSPIDLASEAPFSIAAVTVAPASLEVCRDGQLWKLEPRVMQVLVALAHRRGTVVSRGDLMAAGWGDRVVGQDALYRTIMEVRKLAKESGAFTLENVQRVGYRLDPAGVSNTRLPGNRSPALVGLALAAAVTLVVIGLLLWRARDGRLPGQNGRVEVAAFAALQADPALDNAAVALAEALARLLANSGVETTLRPGPDGAGPPSEFRIAGSVDRTASKYVTNVQIIDRRSAAVLWSGRFDRDATSPAGFPEQVANRVDDTLFCALGSRTRSRKALSPQVFGYFLNACFDRRPPNGGSARFFEVTRRLTEAAPDLSVAHSLHAVAAAVLAADATGGEPYFQITQAAADRALQLDARNGEAYFALGIRHRPGTDWLERERNFARAAELTPNLSVIRNYAVDLLREVGRVAEADALNAQVTGRDVYSPSAVRNLALAHVRAGERPAATPLLERLDLIEPGMAAEARRNMALWWTPPGEAIGQVQAAPQLTDADRACFLTYLKGLARTGAGRGLPSDCAGVQPDWRIRMLGREGDVDAVYAALPRAPGALKDTSFLFFPEMAGVRNDRRFIAFARDIGLLGYWRQSGHWPDFCAAPGLVYDCRNEAGRLP